MARTLVHDVLSKLIIAIVIWESISHQRAIYALPRYTIPRERFHGLTTSTHHLEVSVIRFICPKCRLVSGRRRQSIASFSCRPARICWVLAVVHCSTASQSDDLLSIVELPPHQWLIVDDIGIRRLSPLPKTKRPRGNVACQLTGENRHPFLGQTEAYVAQSQGTNVHLWLYYVICFFRGCLSGTLKLEESGLPSASD